MLRSKRKTHHLPIWISFGKKLTVSPFKRNAINVGDHDKDENTEDSDENYDHSAEKKKHFEVKRKGNDHNYFQNFMSLPKIMEIIDDLLHKAIGDMDKV